MAAVTLRDLRRLLRVHPKFCDRFFVQDILQLVMGEQLSHARGATIAFEAREVHGGECDGAMGALGFMQHENEYFAGGV